MAIRQIGPTIDVEETKSIYSLKNRQIEIANELKLMQNSVLLTYDPTSKQIDFRSLGPDEYGTFVRRFNVLNQESGTSLYELDGLICTAEAIAEIGLFSISSTSRLKGYSADYIDGPANVRNIEKWLNEYGDDESAGKVRERFPKAFEPESAPVKRRWPWQR